MLFKGWRLGRARRVNRSYKGFGEPIPKRGTVERPGFPHLVAAWAVRENARLERGSGVCIGLNFNPPCLCVRTLAHTHLLTWLSLSPFAPAPPGSRRLAEGLTGAPLSSRPCLLPSRARFLHEPQ